MSVNEVLSFCLTARNLALAQKSGNTVMTPCSACYTNLCKTETYMKEFPDVKKKVNEALGEAGMKYEGGVAAKHVLQAIVEDFGIAKVQSLVKKPLKGLRVAPYYGCQILRPYPIDKSPEDPTIFENLLEALGATPTYFPMKAQCCGGALMGTREEVALRLCRNLLLCAQQEKADCIAVTCPLCQMNLDVYQSRINRIYSEDFKLPIVYFTQMMGLAFGFKPEELGFKQCIVPANELARKYA
jgi:heterodisulfide reductase subunit B